MADQAIYAPQIILDANGLPVPGARAYFYASGTNTLIDVYTDNAGTILASNPTEADGAGYVPQRFFNGEAKVVIQTPAGGTIRTIDPVPRSTSATSAAGDITFASTPNLPQLNVQAAIEATDTNARAREAVVASNAQPVDADLTAIAGLSRAQGDLIQGGASAWERLGIGAAGRVLQSNGTSAAWVDTRPTFVVFDGLPVTGTYSRTGTLVTCTIVAHGMTTGQLVNLNFTTGTATDGNYPVTVTGVDTFTVVDTASGATSGNVTRQTWIKASRNVANVAYNGTGDYTINFSPVLANADYAWAGSARWSDPGSTAMNVGQDRVHTKTANALQVRTSNVTQPATFLDSAEICVMITI